ncbi:hypothetical protein B0T14DRAFT_501180 [Immersiella caudata]|uniref:Uncharacterized protein n=1 Tax=Immersiella caudata TaxID=314043 RepID=A0AA39U0W0_9PEZI|nr:hypothetical protein B0T14DRAFT_501180 [Immersiella caudata]
MELAPLAEGDTSNTKTLLLPNEHLQQKRPRSLRQRTARLVSDSWWWELSSVSLSTICMALLLTLLIKVRNMPLEAWGLPIQPNSLISIFTTVGRTSMMVSIASCLSHLKWSHYLRRADKLDGLQLFDDASRGPWGAAEMLLHIRRGSSLGWALALVTVVSLGIGPSSQQVLDFPSRESVMRNATASLGRADNFRSKALSAVDRSSTTLEGWWISFVRGPEILTLETSIKAGIAGNILEPAFHCPSKATRCVWENLTTLAWCAKQGMARALLTERSCQVVNWSSLKEPESIGTLFSDDFLAIACNYTLPRPIGSPSGEWVVVNHPFPLWAEEANNRTISAAFGSMAGYSFNGFEIFMVQAPANVSLVNITPRHNWTSVQEALDSIVASVPQAYGSSTELYPCARTFSRVTASAASIRRNTPDSIILEERLVYSDSLPTEPGLWPWAGSPSMTFRSPTTGQRYKFDDLGTGEMIRYVGATLECNLGRWDTGCMYLVHHKNVSEAMDNLAATMSNHLRNPDQGDNMNATMADGVAFFTEVYIAVRWQWVLLPLIETVLVVVLLIAVIVSTKGEPQIKESVVAYLHYGLDEKAKAALDSCAKPARDRSEIGAHDLLLDAKGRSNDLARSAVPWTRRRVRLGWAEREGADVQRLLNREAIFLRTAMRAVASARYFLVKHSTLILSKGMDPSRLPPSSHLPAIQASIDKIEEMGEAHCARKTSMLASRSSISRLLDSNFGRPPS